MAGNKITQVLDLFPHFEYARYLRSQTEKIPPEMILNLFTDVRRDLIPVTYPPTFVRYGGKLMMAGSTYDLINGAAYYLAKPDEQYAVDIYDDEELALERHESVWGYDYYDIPLQPVTQPSKEKIKESYDLIRCVINGESLNEDENDDLQEVKPCSDAVAEIKKYCVGFVNDFSLDNKPIVSPCFVGNTGVSKSSLVKEAITQLNREGKDKGKWGFRLVDIRAAFLDKQDLLGFCKEVTLDSGLAAFTDSPNVKLLTCSTQFVMECRKFLTDNIVDMKSATNKYIEEGYRLINEYLNEVNEDDKNNKDDVMFDTPVVMPNQYAVPNVTNMSNTETSDELEKLMSHPLLKKAVAAMVAKSAPDQAPATSLWSPIKSEDDDEKVYAEAGGEEKARFYQKLSYYARTPIIWLDEINRCPTYIYNEIMNIVQQGMLNKHDFKICPKLGAGNLAIDCDNITDEQAAMINYYTTNIGDMACFDRWKPVWMVSSKEKSTIDSTFKWLARTFESSPMCVAVLNWAKEKGLLYDVGSMDRYGKFPTFRGWEDCCKYMSYWEANLKGTDAFVLNVITGLLGEKFKSDLIDILSKFTDSGKQIEDNKSMERFVEHTMMASIPTLLLGRMAIAKTAVINKMAKKVATISLSMSKTTTGGTDTSGILIEGQNLAAQDRNTVGGYPKSAPFFQHLMSSSIPAGDRKSVFGKGYVYDPIEEAKMASHSLFKDCEEKMLANPEIPKQTTRFIPDESIQRKVDEIRELAKQGIKKKLVLNFDEMNRASPIVQSAVFEAISENRFRGVDLSGIDVCIVASGNWEHPQTVADKQDGTKFYNIMPVDTASLHRFATFFCEEISPEMYREWLAHVKVNEPSSYDIMTLPLEANSPYKTMEDRGLALLNTQFSPDAPTAPGGGGSSTTTGDSANLELGGSPSVSMSFKSFTYRTLYHINMKMRQMDYDMLPENSASLPVKDIIRLLRSPRYILTTEDFGVRTIIPSVRVKGVFPPGQHVSYRDIVSKVIELFEKQPPIDNVLFSNLILLLGSMEGMCFDGPLAVVLSSIQESLRPQVGDLISSYIHKRTLDRLAFATTDVFSDDPQERSSCIVKVLGDFNPVTMTSNNIYDSIVEALRLHEGSVNKSRLQEIVDEINSSKIKQIGTDEITLLGLLEAIKAALLMDKVVDDSSSAKKKAPAVAAPVPILAQPAAPAQPDPDEPKLTQGLHLQGHDFISPANSVIAGYVAALSKYVDVISSRDPSVGGDSVGTFYIGSTGFSNGEQAEIIGKDGGVVIPDMFTIYARAQFLSVVGAANDAVKPGDDASHAIFFDPEVWKWAVTDQAKDQNVSYYTTTDGVVGEKVAKADTFTLTFTTKSDKTYGYHCSVTINEVRNQMFRHVNADKMDWDSPTKQKVICDREWADPNGLLPQISTKLWSAVILTEQLYGGKSSDLPDIDSADMRKISEMKKTVVGDQTVTQPTLAIYAPLFRRTWRYVETLFSFS